jgi:hypothetical protein
MTCRTPRRAFAALALTAALSTLPVGTAQAGALRWRESSPAGARVVETRGFLAEIWTRFVSVIGGAGALLDNNG